MKAGMRQCLIVLPSMFLRYTMMTMRQKI